MMRSTQQLMLGLVAVLLPQWALSQTHANPHLVWQGTAQEPGVRLDASVHADSVRTVGVSVLPAGRTLRLQLDIRDDITNQPVRGLRPRAWMSRLTADPPETCVDQVRRFVGGRFMARADKDLNGWQILTLNGDSTLSVINPQINVGNTRLESLVNLPGVGAEMVHLKAKDRALVTLPQQGALAVADLGTYSLVQRIELGSGQPRRLVVTPDERRAFVAMDDSAQLAMVDLDRGRVMERIDVGAGLHGLILAGDGNRAVVTSTSSGQVTLVDAVSGAVVASHRVGGKPLAAAFSRLSGLVYVARVGEESLAVFDAASGARQGDLRLASGITALRVDPSGRWLVGVDPANSRIHVLDTSKGRLLGSAQTVEQPDQVVFTKRFAYVRGLASLGMTLLDLGALAQGELATTQVPVHQRLPSAAPGEIGVADMIAPSPDGAGVLIANGADTAIQAYMEGMQAAQGSYRTYSRAVRAIQVVDRSLQETEGGRFEVNFRLDRGGRHSLAVLVDQPRIVKCFDVEVDETGLTPTGARIAVRHQEITQMPVVGRSVPLRVRLEDADTAAPLKGLSDVQLMVLELPGLSQQRQFMREVEPGVYEAEQRFPRPGTWRAMVQIGSKGLHFDRSPTLDIDVRPSR